ncbi:glycosyltransferase family 2 protein [Lactiplantibacillus plantarum]|uniref:glycosyltransferase family 2 protein n=1 Tax=Lactiplantibacillus plantarum TaxID=1590 RepID=UPI002FE6574E
MSYNVAILMSTYNGMDYLREQIESIRSQTYKQWNLYIRDDGSSDNTIDLIKTFVHQDARIHFINADNQVNRGVKRSFLNLLSSVKADFYMFCDQDDYWLPNKVKVTLDAMISDYHNKPRLVFTNMNLVDFNLKVLEKASLSAVNISYWTSKDQLMFDNIVTGCTVMINNQLKQYVFPISAKKIVMHDWYIAQLASQLGDIQYVTDPTILYRQHESNQVGVNKSLFGKVKKLARFNDFQTAVILQISQGRLTQKKSQVVFSKTTQAFLNWNFTCPLILKVLPIIQNNFKKHTWPGTIALNLALLRRKKS